MKKMMLMMVALFAIGLMPVFADDPTPAPKDNPAPTAEAPKDNPAPTTPAESPQVQSLKECVAALQAEFASFKGEVANRINAERAAVKSDFDKIKGEIAEAKKDVLARLDAVRQENGALMKKNQALVHAALADFNAKLEELRAPQAPAPVAATAPAPAAPQAPAAAPAPVVQASPDASPPAAVPSASGLKTGPGKLQK